jgi:hypothetical protein
MEVNDRKMRDSQSIAMLGPIRYGLLKHIDGWEKVMIRFSFLKDKMIWHFGNVIVTVDCVEHYPSTHLKIMLFTTSSRPNVTSVAAGTFPIHATVIPMNKAYLRARRQTALIHNTIRAAFRESATGGPTFHPFVLSV